MSRIKITLGTINYVIRKDNIDKSGSAPIRLRYSYRNKESSFMVGRSIHPVNWDDDDKVAVYISKAVAKKIDPSINPNMLMSNANIMDLNTYLSELEILIKEIENELKEFDSKEVIDELRNKLRPGYSKSKDISLPEFIQQNTDENRNKLASGTIKHYITIRNTISSYERSKGREFKISKINYDYMSGLADYMISIGLVNATIKKRIMQIRVFLNRAKERGYNVSESPFNFSWADNETEVVALTMDELSAIENVALSVARQIKVRDVFLFMCYTGLRYSDVCNLKKHHVSGGFIRLRATKTKDLNAIPIMPKAKIILEKYSVDYNDKIFPTPSNQKFNKYMKEVAKIAGLSNNVEKIRFKGSKKTVDIFPRYEQVTAHTARRTFVTLSLELGMKAEEIMPITGHKDYKSFKRYVKVTEKRAKEALLSAWDSL